MANAPGRASLRWSRPAMFALLYAVAAILPGAQRPSLVLVISVDQMRADYIDRFRPWFGRDGFNRFLERGAVYVQAHHRHSNTETAPGHASIGTGLDPRHHGITSNRSFEPATGGNPYLVADPQARSVGEPGGVPLTDAPASPVRLDGSSLGDRLKERFPKSRVVAIALKDRAAVFMAGRKADAAVWFDDATAQWVTSSYYPPHPSLLGFDGAPLQAFLKDPRHGQWNLSGRIPPAEMDRVTFDPPELARYKDPMEGMGANFPHPLRSVRALLTSPFGDELTLEFARFVIRTEALGRNPSGAPDLFFLGLSSTDLCGHRYGPDSREIADGMVRLDGSLQSFFRWLDAWMGRRRSLVFLTSDHGVTSIPEVARERERRGGREPGPDAFGRIDLGNPGGKNTVAEAGADRLQVERRVAHELGYTLDEKRSNADEAAIASFQDGFAYLNRPVLARRGIDLERAKRAVAAALRERPGVAAAYTNTEMGNGLPAGAAAGAAVERSFRADRAGEIYVILKPGWIWFYRANAGTTHGQPGESDSHVPLLAWGAGVASGRYENPTSPLAIAKTVGAIFDLAVGEPDVKPLSTSSPISRPAAAAR